jgi:hypothetical protein
MSGIGWRSRLRSVQNEAEQHVAAAGARATGGAIAGPSRRSVAGLRGVVAVDVPNRASGRPVRRQRHLAHLLLHRPIRPCCLLNAASSVLSLHSPPQQRAN